MNAKKFLSEIKKYLSYDPDTGIFIWQKPPPRGKDLTGTVAGYKRRRWITIMFLRKQYKAHRLAWLFHYGEWPKGVIDHINHDPSDNRIDNLRDVSPQDNQRNQKARPNSKTGVLGVSINSNKYMATIRHNGKIVYLGRYELLEDAANARKEAEKKYGYHENHGR